MDKCEVRVDDVITKALMHMYNQIPFIESFDPTKSFKELYDFTPIPAKLDKKILNSRKYFRTIYAKLFTIDQIEIIFTLRTAPGQMWTPYALGFLGNLGLSLVSIDSAHLKFSSLQFTHVFGPAEKLVSRIYKHYQRQVKTLPLHDNL